jgi:hypothetical protein
LSHSNKTRITIDLSKIHRLRQKLIEEEKKLDELNNNNNLLFISSSNNFGPELIQHHQEKDSKKEANFNSNNNKSNKDEFMLKILQENKIDPHKLVQLFEIISLFNQNDTHQFIKALGLSISISEFERLKQSLEKLKEIHEKNSKNFNIYKNQEESLNKTQQDNYDNSSTYRLPILKSELVPNDRENFIVDVIKEKFMGVNLVKQMEHDSHIKIDLLKQVEPCRKHTFMTNDQRFFQKNYSNMKFGCLAAIDKAYEQRAVLDRKMTNQKVVEVVNEYKKDSKQEIALFKNDLMNSAIESKMKDRDVIESAVIKQRETFDDLKQRIQFKKKKEMEWTQKRRRDVHLAVEFSRQHLSVSKALQRHEHQTMCEEKLNRNVKFVSQLFENKKKQNQLIKNYIEQRNLLRTNEATNEKVMIEKFLKLDREIDENEAKKRVQYFKYREKNPDKFNETQTLESSYYLFVSPPDTSEPPTTD